MSHCAAFPDCHRRQFPLRGLRSWRCRMLATVVAAALFMPAFASAALQVVVVEGLGGDARYTEQFAEQVGKIESASRSLTKQNAIRVFRGADANREQILEHFAALAGQIQASDTLALFLIGHGSYDDHEYKFNIPGPDITGEDLLERLSAIPSGSQLVVIPGSASGAIRERLMADNRTLILGTRSGAERHATRFGNYFAAALEDNSADLDKNRVVTAEEAFRYAERLVTDYFERNGQLATEHPRLEGSQAGRFSLARLGTAQPQRTDAELTRLIARRDELNAAIDSLRLRRESLSADSYQTELLGSMLELATLEEQIEQREAELNDAN